MRSEQPHSSAPVVTVLVLVLHAGLGVFFLLLLLVVVPNYKMTFAGYGVRLPYFAQLAIELSDWAIDTTLPILIVLILLLALDGAVFSALYRREETRLYGWLWFAVISAAALAFVSACWLAARAPFIDLQELQ
jgi:type II secretory pathway component PulF